MKKQLTTLVIVCITLLTACGSSPSVVQIQPSATLAPPTATLAPTLTSTPEPTFTPTATATPRLPVAPGTQMPAPGLAFSADNLDQVVELARWGKGVITDVVYSPDGKLIAVATTLGVSIYQADTLEEKFYFETGASVNSLAFSPNGETIATGLNDGIVGLWNASDGALLKSLEIQKEESDKSVPDKVQVNSVAFSPDGKLLASGLSDGILNIWQVSDATIILTPTTKQRLGISSVFFSPDGNTVFSSSRDGTTNSRNVSDGKIIHAFGGGNIVDAVLSADGKFLATYDHRYYDVDGSLVVWDVENGKKIQTISGGEKYSSNDISSLAFSPDGQLLAGAWEDHTVKIWNVSSGVLQNTFDDLQPTGPYYYSFFTTAFSSDGHSLLLGGYDSVGVWDVTNGTVVKTAVIKSKTTYKIAISPDGKILAAVDGPIIHLWQINDGNLISLQDEIKSNGDVTFSPDGTTLIVSTYDSTAQFWPLSEQGVRRTFEMENKAYILSIAVSPDGQILALEPNFYSQSPKVELRQVSDGLLLRTLGILGTRYGETTFSYSGEFIAVSFGGSLGNAPEIRLFRVSDGQFLKSFNGDSFAFSPDGTLLVGNYDTKSLTVWTIPDGKNALTLKDRPDKVSNVTFSPDGKFLAAGYANGTIEVFLATDGTLLKSWKGHSRGVSDLLFTPDGKLIISSSYDGTIRMWGLKP